MRAHTTRSAIGGVKSIPIRAKYGFRGLSKKTYLYLGPGPYSADHYQEPSIVTK
jgi:hypothetical protein